MAGKKRRKPRRPTSGGPTAPADPGASATERRDRKDQARLAKEAARKRARRSAKMKRVTSFAVVAAVGIGVFAFLQRASSPGSIPQAAIAAAEAAGCGGVETPASSAPGGLHLESGASYSYDQHPATSGYHDPSPLAIPPHVYPAPIAETRAVHNLEHGAVIMYYRQSGDGALAQPILDRLTTIANATDNVILAPYAQLPEGTALALAAWNKLQTCPAGVSGPQAREIALGFIHAFVCTSNAPEGKLGQGC